MYSKVIFKTLLGEETTSCLISLGFSLENVSQAFPTFKNVIAILGKNTSWLTCVIVFKNHAFGSLPWINF